MVTPDTQLDPSTIPIKPPAIALLLADLRKRGMDRTYFLTDDTTSTATMAKARLQKEVRIIKIQHNTTTAGRMEDLDIKMAHEYLTIMTPRSL